MKIFLQWKKHWKPLIAGGIYEGWSIANSNINDDFINALFGVNDNKCTLEEINKWGKTVALYLLGPMASLVSHHIKVQTSICILVIKRLSTPNITSCG